MEGQLTILQCNFNNPNSYDDKIAGLPTNNNPNSYDDKIAGLLMNTKSHRAAFDTNQLG